MLTTSFARNAAIPCCRVSRRMLGSGPAKETLGEAMAVPDFQSLMLPLLKVASAGPVSAPDLRSGVAEQLGLTESDIAELLPSGRKTTLSNRTAWANVYLQRAGLLNVVRRGVYQATPEGLAVLERKPARIDMKFLEQFPSYADWHKRSTTAKGGGTTGDHDDAGETTISSTNPEEQIDRSHKELTAAVEADLLDRVRGVSPAQFEQVIIDLLVAMGYGGGRVEMAKAVGKSGDNGVDGVVREDKLGLDVVYMQAKRYASTNAVGVGEVRLYWCAGRTPSHQRCVRYDVNFSKVCCRVCCTCFAAGRIDRRRTVGRLDGYVVAR